jgi:tetratricopeptide (TPR) repeat protein
VAERLGDHRSVAYSLASEIHVSTIVAPKSLEDFSALKCKAVEAASRTGDAYIQNWTRFVIGWEEIHRGLMIDAHESARELIQVGQVLRDPRSTGFGLALNTWIALVSDSFSDALEYSNQSLAVAVTTFDEGLAINGKGCALVLLRQNAEGVKLLEEHRRQCVTDGYLYGLAGIDGVLAVSKIFMGRIREGIALIKEAIAQQEKNGYRDAADWYRGLLIEVYLEIIEGREAISLWALLKNLPTILYVRITGREYIESVAVGARQKVHFHPEGHHLGRLKMLLGLLYKARKNYPLAVQNLTESQQIFSQFGSTPILARVEAALGELQARHV